MFLSSSRGLLSVIGSSILLILLLESVVALNIIDGGKENRKTVQQEEAAAGNKEHAQSKSSTRDTTVIETQVLVLGAGFAGISAAKVLSELGVDFRILEAKNRIGGRVFDGKLGDYTVEYGANWLHYIDANPLWKYAQQYGLKGEIDWLDNYIFRSPEGENVTGRATVLINNYYEAFRRLRTVYNRNCIPGCDKMSMREALRLAGWDVPSTRLHEAVEFYSFDWVEALATKDSSFYGVIQSYLNTAEDPWLERDYIVTDPRGFSYLLRSISNEFLRVNDERLIFNQVVKTIDYRRTESSKVLVHTEDGKVYAADHVIITFSNNVITYGDVQFQPALPEWKLTALRHMPTVAYTKHFIDLTKGIIDDNAYILLVHNGDKWRNNAAWQNLRLLQQFRNVNAALVTNVAAEAVNSARMTSAEAIDFIIASGSENYPALGRVDKSKMTETHYNWVDDRFARGSYPSPIVGLNAKMIDDLKASVDEVLHFAGDGTDLDDYGTVSSAFTNGQTTALRVVATLGK